jgi:hypothetical protein
VKYDDKTPTNTGNTSDNDSVAFVELGTKNTQDNEEEFEEEAEDTAPQVALSKPKSQVWTVEQKGFLFEYIMGPGNDSRFERFKVGPGKIHRAVWLLK